MVYYKEKLTHDIEQGLKSLDETERLVLTLAYYEGLTLAEIALILEIPVEEVDKNLCNAEFKMNCYTSIFYELRNKMNIHSASIQIIIKQED